MKIVEPLPVILPKFAPPPNTPISTNDILSLLDDWSKPGVPLSQFHAHFAMCECSLVMTTRGFDRHQFLVPLDDPGADDNCGYNLTSSTVERLSMKSLVPTQVSDNFQQSTTIAEQEFRMCLQRNLVTLVWIPMSCW